MNRLTTSFPSSRWLGCLAVLSCAVAWGAGAAPAGREFTAAERGHWAYQPVTRPAAPAGRQAGWVRTPIDAFILAGLEARGLRPSPPADPATLLRRASLDLTGLPPSLPELEQFLADAAPGAFERAVDRLLASPHYGERGARHWLDLARYADSEGFKSDETRPHAWRYRDYVIQALNDDKPYDRFVQEQIAGDDRVQPALRGRKQRAQPDAAAPGNPERHHGHRRLRLPRPHLRLRPLPRPQV
jgi:hypothetical protein